MWLSLLKLGVLVVLLVIVGGVYLYLRIKGGLTQVIADATLAGQPDAIHLVRDQAVDWQDREAVARHVQGFRKLGFRAIGSFRIRELENIRLVGLGHPDDGYGAVVYEARDTGLVHCDAVAMLPGGRELTVSSVPHVLETPPHQEKIRLKGAAPAKLVKTLRRHVNPIDLVPIHPRNFTALLEASYAEEMKWRRRQDEPDIVRDPELDAASAPVFEAVAGRDLTRLEILATQGTPLEGRNARGETPLMAAIGAGEQALVVALLEAGAEPNTRAPGSPGDLDYDPVEMIRMQAQESDDPDEQEAARGIGNFLQGLGAGQSAENTPLTYAVETGIPEMVHVLGRHGAYVNGSDDVDPPLHFASAQGDLDMVRALVESGADVNALDGAGRTALFEAAEAGHLDVVEYLVDAETDVDVVCEGESAVMAAAAWGAEDVVRYLGPRSKKRLRRKAEKLLAESEMTPPDGRLRRLFTAASRGRVSMIRKLVAAGLHPDSRSDDEDSEGGTALMAAIEWGHLEAVRALIFSGADVNVAGFDGTRPLSQVLGRPWIDDVRKRQIVELLIAEGARLDLVDPDQRSELEQLLAANVSS